MSNATNEYKRFEAKVVSRGSGVNWPRLYNMTPSDRNATHAQLNSTLYMRQSWIFWVKRIRNNQFEFDDDADYVKDHCCLWLLCIDIRLIKTNQEKVYLEPNRTI